MNSTGMESKSYNIIDAVNSFGPWQDKSYVNLLSETCFYELGFGRRGLYKGHSHLFFTDVLFSPTGIKIYGIDQVWNCVIVPPRTYLPDVEIGDFFFIKFCHDLSEFSPPEKVSYKIFDDEVYLLNNKSSSYLTTYGFQNRLNNIEISLLKDMTELLISYSNVKIIVK
jgi:hypothetical protein